MYSVNLNGMRIAKQCLDNTMNSTTILFLLLLYGAKSERRNIQDTNPDNNETNKFFSVLQDNSSCIVHNNCANLTMHSFCGVDGKCTCDFGYYQLNSTNNFSVCTQCPGQGDDCSESDCCYSTSASLSCISGICQCTESYICWSTDVSQSYRFQKVAQFILAIGLIFTSIIIVILFWKACSSGVHNTIPHVDSFVSLNSIQRLVLLRLQDRPPTYSQIYQPMKRQANSRRTQTLPNAPAYEEPPPYSETAASNHVYNNRIFFINEPTSNENTITSGIEILPHVTVQPVSGENKPELHI